MKHRYFALLFAVAALSAQTRPGADLGFTDTPMLPGQKWHVHDPARPYPPVVTPGAKPDIDLEQLVVTLPNGVPQVAADAFTVRHGERTLLTGPSGSGKWK